jgi:uncharacterized protein
MVEVTQLASECSDPKDDNFLDLVLAVSAEMIVASDPYPTQLHPWRSIPILPPTAFLVCGR